MPAGQSNWGNFLTEVPSSQMFLVVSIWQKTKKQKHIPIYNSPNEHYSC